MVLAGQGTGGGGMPTTVVVRDETTGGKTTHELSLEFLTERITVRELIRSRIYQEVQDFNRECKGTFRGLVQPTGAEQVLNGFQFKKPRQIDWKQQFDQATAAFDAERILVLVDDKQATSLDEEIELRTDTDVAFLKLIPLVGG
jgi:hypothetical protein